MKGRSLGSRTTVGAAGHAGGGHNPHKNASDVQHRLARIEGHVRAIRRMAAEGVPCPDVLVQIAAVRAALNGVGRIILSDHLRDCVVKAVHEKKSEKTLRDLMRSMDRFIA
ncbi:MAG: metal-sensing transcriptional repressor [Elusimicrobia bacterium]|nr:metal-sensing transcriptional repressor [Elusimicrobiota bacterium]